VWRLDSESSGYIYPEIAKSLDATKEATIETLKNENEKLTTRLHYLETNYAGLEASIATRPIVSVFVKRDDNEVKLLPGLDIGIDATPPPRVSDNGEFVIFLKGSIFNDPWTRIDSSTPYEFEHQGKLYYFIAEPVKPFRDRRIKISVFTGPAPTTPM
jgi:hypothetical protein